MLKRGDRVAGLVFMGFPLAHNLFFHGDTGYVYFATDGIFFLGIVLLLSKLKQSKLVIRLMDTCIGLVLLTIINLGMWVNYLPVQVVNYLFVIIYIYSMCLIIGASNGRLLTLFSDILAFSFHFNKDRDCHQDMQGGAEI
jgi:hypothetical protein